MPSSSHNTFYNLLQCITRIAFSVLPHAEAPKECHLTRRAFPPPGNCLRPVFLPETVIYIITRLLGNSSGFSSFLLCCSKQPLIDHANILIIVPRSVGSDGKVARRMRGKSTCRTRSLTSFTKPATATLSRHGRVIRGWRSTTSSTRTCKSAYGWRYILPSRSILTIFLATVTWRFLG